MCEVEETIRKKKICKQIEQIRRAKKNRNNLIEISIKFPTSIIRSSTRKPDISSIQTIIQRN